VGVAVANSSLGLASAISKAISTRFNVSEEKALAVFTTKVLRYNATDAPTRATPSPNVSTYDAKTKYAELASGLGLGGGSVEEKIDELVKHLKSLKAVGGLPRSVEQLGVKEGEYMAAISELAEACYGNQVSSGIAMAVSRLPSRITDLLTTTTTTTTTTTMVAHLSIYLSIYLSI